jgi:branched-chain amino acid transport system permease protein
LVAVYVVLPFVVSDYWLSVLNLAAIAAIGALGLDVVTGYAGQLSLGHAALLGAGAYTSAAVGGALPVWLVAAAAVGALVGALVVPFALRLRGHTLAVATLALVFVAQRVFQAWTPVTGGNAGRSDLPSAVPNLPGTLDQRWFWVAWALVAVAAAAVAVLVRGRVGRAMVALRGGEEAAAVMGVDVARTKLVAFAVAGALAGAAGALYGSYKHYVGPEDWGLAVSIQYLAMVFIGGSRRVSGPVLGALFVVGLPRVVEEIVPTGAAGAAQVSQILFGLAVVGFVLARAHRTRQQISPAIEQRVQPRM